MWETELKTCKGEKLKKLNKKTLSAIVLFWMNGDWHRNESNLNTTHNWILNFSDAKLILAAFQGELAALSLSRHFFKFVASIS